MAFAFLLLNLLTGTRYPFVWIDEVMYADPAANLWLGNGFTSSAWYVQHSNEFWAGNVPLYPALLFLWMKLFGFSILSVRSLNYVLLMASGWLLWSACIRLQLIRTSAMRLLMLILLATGYSMIFAYRSARPDCLTLFLVCLAFYTHSRECWRQRIFGSMAIGALMPWAGLQLFPLLAASGILLVIYARRKALPSVLALWTGAGIGLIALWRFYVAHGVWDRFLASVHQQTGISFFGWLLRGELRHSNMAPKDFSFAPLFALAIVLAAWNLTQATRSANRLIKSPLGFGILNSIATSLALFASGKFPTYYGWMIYMPLAVCVCATLSEIKLSGMCRILCAALLGITLLIGPALHGITAAADWHDRKYSNVEKLVRDNVRSNDWMYGEFSTYYATKKTAARVFMPLYLPAFLPEEKERLTVLVIAPTNLPTVIQTVGGNWISTKKGFTPSNPGFWRRNMGFLSTQNYELEVYRRAGK